jgi:hypothetical protein
MIIRGLVPRSVFDFLTARPKENALDPISSTTAALTTVAQVVDYFKSNVASHVTDTSIAQLTKLTRIEPLTVISQDCSNLDYLPDVLNNLSSVVAGFYLQAFAILTQVNNIEVVRILDRLNPSRDGTGFLLQGRMSTESVDNQFVSSYKYALPTGRLMAGEAADNDSILDKGQVKTIYETASLAVGKLLNVPITIPADAGRPAQTFNIPVNVRLSPTIMNTESLGYLFTHRKSDESFVERIHSWREGRISLIKDVIFAQDLIREYRRAAMKDKSGVLNEIVRRVNNNRFFGLLTKNPSLATVSNLYVLSKSTAQGIEAKIGCRFNDPNGRAKILKDTYAMVVAVVDTESEWITYYFDGIAQPLSISVRALKSSNKDKGPDIGDIMRSLLDGRAPSF